MDFQVFLSWLEMILFSAIFVTIHYMFTRLFNTFMRQLKSFILVFFILCITACSDSNSKSEDNTAFINDLGTVQDQKELEIKTEGQAIQQESEQFTKPSETSSKQISPGHHTDSIGLEIISDSLKQKMAKEEEAIALSRKKIFNYQEELNFFRSQQSKLNTDDSMSDALERIDKNVETVQGHIEKEEEIISLAKANISQMDEDLENIKILQSPAPAPEKITIEKADTKLDQQHSGPINKQALEKELKDLKKLNQGVNARILYYEHMLDSLSTIDKEPEQEQLKPGIVLEDKQTHKNIDRDAANHLQDLANQTISEKKNLSTEQVKVAKGRNSSDTNIQANRGFAKFIGVFFFIILVLVGSLYFLGKSFQGKKK